MNHSSKRHVTQEMNQCCVCTSHAAYQRIHFKVYLLITCFNVSINVEPISHFPHKNVKKRKKEEGRLETFAFLSSEGRSEHLRGLAKALLWI